MIKNSKGVALILVISCVSLLSILMVEFTFGTQVNFKIARNFQNAAKAKALAQSGISFAMLELKAYTAIKNHPAIKQIPGFSQDLLDKIWQFGFIYPPIVSKKATFGTEKSAQELIETSKIDGKITVQIFDESSKINLNDLEPIQTRAAALQQLETLFEQKKISDEEFYQKYRDTSFKSLLNHIIDWIDKDKDRLEGGDENNYYSRLKNPYKTKNAPLDALSELALIEGFENDDFYRLLLPYATIYPSPGININTADKVLLMSISPELRDSDVIQIIERRQKQGYFKNIQEFEDFCKNTLLKSAGFNTNPKVKLTTTSTLFSIESTGEVKGAVQMIKAMVDITKTSANGSPFIVYWN